MSEPFPEAPITWQGRDAKGNVVVVTSEVSLITQPPAVASSGGALPDWFVPDENNQTFDFWGGLHMYNDDGPAVDNMPITIDGRDSAGSLITLSPTATNRVLLNLQAPTGQAAAVITAAIGGTDRLLVASTGAVQVIPDGTTTMLSVTATDVDIANNKFYADATTIAFFGANGSAQNAAIVDATDPATTMSKLNEVLALLRALGLVAAA